MQPLQFVTVVLLELLLQAGIRNSAAIIMPTARKFSSRLRREPSDPNARPRNEKPAMGSQVA